MKEAAATPPNRTALTPVKFSPLIVMVDPIGADAGLNEVSTGLRNVNPAKLSAVIVLLMRRYPLAPAPTVAVIIVSD